jgi:hypothetical protein
MKRGGSKRRCNHPDLGSTGTGRALWTMNRPFAGQHKAEERSHNPCLKLPTGTSRWWLVQGIKYWSSRQSLKKAQGLGGLLGLRAETAAGCRSVDGWGWGLGRASQLGDVWTSSLLRRAPYRIASLYVNGGYERERGRRALKWVEEKRTEWNNRREERSGV